MTSVIATRNFTGTTVRFVDDPIRRSSRAPPSGLKSATSLQSYALKLPEDLRSNSFGPVLGLPSVDCLSRKGGRLCTSRGSLNRVSRGRKGTNRNAVRNESNSSKTDISEQDLGKSEESEESHMDILERMTRGGSGLTAAGKTIAEQLAEDAEQSKEVIEEFTVRLGSGKVDLDASDLTISQKRNIRRQNYLNQVSRRNDSRFFATVGLFVLLPPAVILGVAVATGYIELPR